MYIDILYYGENFQTDLRYLHFTTYTALTRLLHAKKII